MISIARIFGAPVSVPAGKVARSTSMRVSRLELAVDVADDVHHVRVALDHEVRSPPRCRSRRRGRCRCAPRSTSMRCSARSFSSASSSASSAVSSSGVVPRRRVPASGRIVTLSPSARARGARGSRASADELEVVHVEVVHVRRRVQRAQRAVQRQRRLGEALAHPLAELHLHHVAGGDVLLGCAHRRE